MMKSKRIKDKYFLIVLLCQPRGIYDA